MFERFTAAARDVVRGSCGYADRTGAAAVGEGELLLALLDRTDTPGARVLGALGVRERRASVEHALAAVRRRGGMSAPDAEALAGLGIDVEEIVARVEREHGPGALAGPVRRRGKRSHRPFAPEAKSVLERSLRIALGRGDRHIGDEHLLLAMTAGPGVAGAVLAEHGVTRGEVERVLDAL